MSKSEGDPGDRKGRPGRPPLSRELQDAAGSLESARGLLELKEDVGRALRAAIRCLLDAQEGLETSGPGPEVRLRLLDAIRHTGAASQLLKEWDDPFEAGSSRNESDRRAFPRVGAHYSVSLEPEASVSQVPAGLFPVSGITLNVSRGGMLARVERLLDRRSRYRVRFFGTAGKVEPESAWAEVRRTGVGPAGWEVGLEFDSPLRLLSPDGELEASG